MIPFDKALNKKLDSPKLLKILLSQKKIDVDKGLQRWQYQKLLKQKQIEMVRLQNDIIANKRRVIVIFEGRDAAGKGGAIRRVTEHINPRYFKIVALPKPKKEALSDWYFSRYVEQFPAEGQIVFFDRSWYNRAVVEPVNGFCTAAQYDCFMRQVNTFEKMITESGIELLKIYMSISKKEQAIRLEEIKNNPLKKWKMTPVDERAQILWDDYTHYKKRMFKHTGEVVDWKVIKADKKMTARLTVLDHLLLRLPYDKTRVI